MKPAGRDGRFVMSKRDDAIARVEAARMRFERRFSLSSLKTADPELARKLREQVSWYEKGIIKANTSTAMGTCQATVRGYQAAYECLIEATGDLSYCVGVDAGADLALVISHDEADTDEVRKVYPQKNVIHINRYRRY